MRTIKTTSNVCSDCDTQAVVEVKTLHCGSFGLCMKHFKQLLEQLKKLAGDKE